MRALWLTDIHLDHLRDAAAFAAFAARVSVGHAPFDGAIVTGDISTAQHLKGHLEALAAAWGRPVWFVLGNHDYYGGGIKQVRTEMASLVSHPLLTYLPQAGPIKLSPTASLVGIDGWGDGRLGRPETTPVLLNDFVLVRELEASKGRMGLLSTVRRLGDDEAARCRELLAAAAERSRRVVVATHVPPFREACWHRGGISDDDWLPWFTCKAVGDALVEAAETHPDKQFLVLCGHTHTSGTATILPNLVVRTGGAVYGSPKVEDVLEFA
ncbi:unnamed protein product [Ostreobium quekettii]|uniref:Calcineurin-like phosphoesterase domain-containing protein n=1 Tax=Ostreobium quekettii TaxID=121088 RepID=A0A8S1J340_9CHLO|nr:unnamed protein product [Ostreobium quekettii]